jgi:hypothetical protein
MQYHISHITETYRNFYVLATIEIGNLFLFQKGKSEKQRWKNARRKYGRGTTTVVGGGSHNDIGHPNIKTA